MCLPGKPDDLNSILGTHLKKAYHGSSLCYPSFNCEMGRRQGPPRSLACVVYRSYKRDPGFASPGPQTLGLPLNVKPVLVGKRHSVKAEPIKYKLTLITIG